MKERGRSAQTIAETFESVVRRKGYTEQQLHQALTVYRRDTGALEAHS